MINNVNKSIHYTSLKCFPRKYDAQRQYNYSKLGKNKAQIGIIGNYKSQIVKPTNFNYILLLLLSGNLAAYCLFTTKCSWSGGQCGSYRLLCWKVHNQHFCMCPVYWTCITCTMKSLCLVT